MAIAPMDGEPTEREPVEAVWAPASPRATSWRYLGERTAADLAYCVRFGVTVAPEPYVAPGGALAYALPVEQRTR